MAKPVETKARFIEMRAEGHSYAAIAKELNISKSTCSEWQRELREQIETERQGRLEGLYRQYGLIEEARVERLGKIIERLDAAIEQADLGEMDPHRLLEMALKYAEAAKQTYKDPQQFLNLERSRRFDDTMRI